MSELSLKTLGDYTMTVPEAEDDQILGIGIGESDCPCVRLEDIVFLKEAYAEREMALRATKSHYRDLWPFFLPLVLADFRVLKESNMAYLFAESFDNDRPWSEYSYLKRGENPSYVPTDFAVGGSATHAIDIGDDWTVDIPDYGPTDVRQSYLPVMTSQGTRIVPPDLVLNERLWRALQLELIHGLYHNLTLMHDIVTAPGEGVAEPYNGGYQRANRYWRRTSPTGYEMTEYDLPYGGKGTYRSGYLGFASDQDTTTTDVPSEHPTLPFWKYEANIVMRAEIGWKIAANGWDLGAVLSTYLDLEDNTTTTLYDFKRLHVYSPLITVDNFPLCSDISAVAVCGFEAYDTDEGRSEYNGADYWHTRSTTQRAWMSVPLALTRTDDVYEGSVVFDSDFNFDRVLTAARTHFGYNGNWPAVVQPNTATVPSSTTSAPTDNITGEHRVTRVVSFAWIKIIFRFKRDFRAKVLD